MNLKSVTNTNSCRLDPRFLIEGHRGTRGLMPENTIPSMIKAVQDGASVLEMDLQFTADGNVVVAHDAYINPVFSLDSNGFEIPIKDARKYCLFEMNYEKIAAFDVGSKGHPKFPKQELVPCYIPLLNELIFKVEEYVATNHLDPVFYNIEIKASIQTDGKHHPKPMDLLKKVMSVLTKAHIEGRYSLQSFDNRQIIESKRCRPEVPVSFLTEDYSKTIEEHLALLGFFPETYSPHFKLVNQRTVKQAHDLQMNIIPWTVNKKSDMQMLINMGVDGIITDYPGKLSRLYNSSLFL